MSKKKDTILKWFYDNKGKVMTIWEAHDVFHANGGTFTSAVSRLRRAGEPIETEWFENPETGERFKGYFMHETSFSNLS